jgi:hypothetical protein
MKYEILRNQSNLHWYNLADGSKLQRYQLADKVYELFENGKELIIPEVAKTIGIEEVIAAHIIRSLVIKDLLARKNKQKRRHRIYFQKHKCALANMLYPKTIVDKFDIKNRKSYKIDEGKNISYPLSTPHMYGTVNTIYEGGE